MPLLPRHFGIIIVSLATVVSRHATGGALWHETQIGCEPVMVVMRLVLICFLCSIALDGLGQLNFSHLLLDAIFIYCWIVHDRAEREEHASECPKDS